MTARVLSFTVLGRPVGQGNHRVSSRGYVYETTKGHKQWRNAIVETATYHMRLTNWSTATDAVELSAVFYLRRPLTAVGRLFPTKRPDCSKLVRALEDALTKAGVWLDDSLVVSYRNVDKRYVTEEHPKPCVVVTVKVLDRVASEVAA